MKTFTKANLQGALATALMTLGNRILTAQAWCLEHPIGGTIAYYLYSLAVYVVLGWIMGDTLLAWTCWVGIVIYAVHLVATYKYGHWLAKITTDTAIPLVRKNVPLTMLGAIVCMLTGFTYTGIAIVAFGLVAYAHIAALEFTAKLHNDLAEAIK